MTPSSTLLGDWLTPSNEPASMLTVQFFGGTYADGSVSGFPSAPKLAVNDGDRHPAGSDGPGRGLSMHRGRHRAADAQKGLVDLPISTHVFVRETEMWVGFTQAEDLEWQAEPPVEGLAVEFRAYGEDGQRGVEVWASEDLPPNAYVVLWDYASDSDVTTFTTGTDRDEAPPTWSPRRYTSDFSYTDYAGDECESTVISFRIDGVTDTGGFVPLFLLEPLDALGEIDFGVGEVGESTGVGTSFREACGGDENILKRSGRNYNLTIFDVAGNVLDGGVLRGSCACATTSGSQSGSVLLGLALGVVVLRRKSPRGSNSRGWGYPTDIGSPRAVTVAHRDCRLGSACRCSRW